MAKDSKSPIPPPPSSWRQRSFGLFVAVLVFAIALVLMQLFYVGGRDPVMKLGYTDLIAEVESGNIAEVEFVGRRIEGKFTQPKTVLVGRESLEYKKFELTIPFEDPGLVTMLSDKGVKISAREESGGWWSILVAFLPWLFIPILFIFIFRRMQGNQNGVFNFGKSRAKRITPDRVRVTFADVADCEEAKQELGEVIDFLKNPRRFSKLGGKIPKGVLLLGPPGTGKTLLAKAVSGEANVPFFSVSGSDFVEMFVGVGASRVRDLFENAKANAPCIVFIDEIDAVGRQRGTGLGGGHDEREQTLNQILVEMDGFETNAGVIVLASTNRPDVLDPALLRAGRFDRRVVIDRPDVKGREGILKVHTRGIPLAKDVDLGVIALGTPGLSGADLANIVNEAALLAARSRKDQVFMDDFEQAKDKVMMGTERKSMMLTGEEKRISAFHEAGHALLGKLLPGSDPVHKVTIIPRGMALGLTYYLPKGDKRLYSKSYLMTKLVHILGGRASEMLIFGDPTTGADNDIEQASRIARKMVCEWGMSEKLGPLDYTEGGNDVFLGKELVSRRASHSEEVNQLIDREVSSLVEGALKQAEEILSKNIDKLNLVAEALIEYESLSGEEIDIILAGGTLNRELKQEPAISVEEAKEKKKEIDAIGGKIAPEPSPEPST
ncbi:MAG TPA: ATP-dependent metallopeptidase FtsH/Yme1/Tma family protein [candidate division Zixibacteria bacterium]|nr:ATP-dependent metallopeptidase FtsH/Yme1/Tma family protein [candidate division Zixibacteria bacterium]